MPTDAEHLTHAKHNISFLESFYSSHQFNDWSITAAFYAAVHVVEANIFTKKDISYRGQVVTISHAAEFPAAVKAKGLKLPNNFVESPHNSRILIVKIAFPHISHAYDSLYCQSRVARYENYIYRNLHIKKIVEPLLRDVINWSNTDFNTNYSLDLSKPPQFGGLNEELKAELHNRIQPFLTVMEKLGKGEDPDKAIVETSFKGLREALKIIGLG